MSTNDSGVITALRFREAARAAQLGLEEEYGKHGFEQNQRRIAGLHQQINYGLKFAEVSALIGVGELLDELVGILQEDRAELELAKLERRAESEVLG